ncbi:hypothetical protein KEM54_001467 [Ascosphaera aggregata]|nr:hypothetical protein KEM54_001467 [Ascosphaera aggregata]
MVLKPLTQFARQALSKSFTHGYAQSVVAASQSSYASQTGSQISQQLGANSKYPRSAQLQTLQPPVPTLKLGSASGDSGLTAYHAAYQQAQHAEETHLHLSRRRGLVPMTEEARSEQRGKEQRGEHVETSSARSRHSPHSSQHDIMQVENVAVNADISARVDEAVAREMRELEEEDAAASEHDGTETPVSGSTHPTSPLGPLVSPKTVHARTPAEIRSEHIVSLAAMRQWAQIPAAFESLLRDRMVPTAQAYNALLEADIQLHADIHDAVPKALDIYSDMLRRNVLPDTETYKILVPLLTSRALSCFNQLKLLEQQKGRFSTSAENGSFILRSSEAEHALLVEDHCLPIVLKLFSTAISRHPEIKFANNVYFSLINVCARSGNVDKMIEIMSDMEAAHVTPHALLFPLMIDAFAANGDLKSAVECYNEYKHLAMADDAGVFSIIGRADGEVYASVVKAYLSCDKKEGGIRFMERIQSSFEPVNAEQQERLAAIQDIVVKDGLVQHAISNGEFAEALEIARTRLSSNTLLLNETAAMICIAAADANNVEIATQAYGILGEVNISLDPAVSMLALHIRQGNIPAAQSFWGVLMSGARLSPAVIHPTAMYTVALLKDGKVGDAFLEARAMFSRVRASQAYASATSAMQSHVREEIDETIDFLGRTVMTSSAILSPPASMNLLWAMIENGGLVSPIAEHVIANLGPESIATLSASDLALVLQVQAGILANPKNIAAVDAAHPLRFAHLLDVAMVSAVPADALRHPIVEVAVTKLNDIGVRPDIVPRWHAFVKPAYVPAPPSTASIFSAPHVVSPVPSDSPVATTSRYTKSPVPKAPEDTFDPYAHTTDFRGSSQIAEELESTSGRPPQHLNEAMTKLRNMRRLGRHPRYITYAKLITAAAKFNRMNLVNEILNMARHDVPLLPQYQLVKYGWTGILDAMVAACLTCGDRAQADRYHQELLDIGAAPSANTFGLYITTLKESTKTFDEATEAVKIFHRATAEGVQPTSFLYNSLIGKLGKARRIDDCLSYFAEMRSNGVRPTSVTYGTIVNALCRVSDEHFAEEMFDEMESVPNYKPRPAPYNSLIQYFLNTKRDRTKVLAYYNRMLARGIQPTMHTYKLLIDAYASLEPVRMDLAEEIIEKIRASGERPEAVHYASMIHAKGCVLHDLDGAREIFDRVIDNPTYAVTPQACLYQALFESLVANHKVGETQTLLDSMAAHGVEMTPYIANTLIHGWAAEGNILNARTVYDDIGIRKREPSTYEAMTRAYLAVEERAKASEVVSEMVSRGYPAAVTGKVLELIGGGVPVSTTR